MLLNAYCINFMIKCSSCAADIDIDNQVYNFTFTANEKLPETVIELLIDNASPPVPYQCRSNNLM